VSVDCCNATRIVTSHSGIVIALESLVKWLAVTSM